MSEAPNIPSNPVAHDLQTWLHELPWADGPRPLMALVRRAIDEIERLKRERDEARRIYDSAVAGRHAFRQMHIRSRNALRRAVEWAAPMAEAPSDSRPEWFDIARAALTEPLSEQSPDETSGNVPYHQMPQHIIDKAVEIRHWFHDHGHKTWSVAGIGPIHSQPAGNLEALRERIAALDCYTAHGARDAGLHFADISTEHVQAFRDRVLDIIDESMQSPLKASGEPT